MTQNVWFIAAIWMALALSASLISIWAGISVALVEILVGVIAGNFLGIHATTDWINFLALLGSGVLTFLAGAEIDPRSLKANLRASGLIGVLSFGVPFVIVWLFAQFVLGWPLPQAQIAGIALSTTSVAVVYAVMIEGGYNDTSMGKTILAACFITDLGTVLALGVLFANFNIWLLVFVVIMLIVLWFMPTWTQFIITRLGATRVSEPEVKFIFFILFFLGGLATTAKSEVSGRSCRGRGFSTRQNARKPDAQHSVRDLYAILFHQGRALRFIAGALGRARNNRGSLALEDDHEACRRVPACAHALHGKTRSELHNASDGNRADLRNHLGVVRVAEQNHRSAAIHNSGQCRDPERICADADRAKVFPANSRSDARVGASLSQAYAGIKRGGCERRRGRMTNF